MAKPVANPLRIYAQRRPETVQPPLEAIGCLSGLLDAFAQATGWSLQYVADPEPQHAAGLIWSAPVSPGVGTSLGHLRLAARDSAPARSLAPAQGGRRKTRKSSDTSAELPGEAASRGGPMVAAEAAQTMASAVADTLNELLRTRHALWQREAELAAGVPLVPQPEEEKHLAARLEAALRAGAEAVGCHAAALYLLDEATTALKLRCCWGLPFDRLLAPARSLKGAVADLEALLGHAVVLEDTKQMRHWHMPEDFPAAVCVPVSTPSTLLGTFWVFATSRRDFDDQQTNLLEIVAGRLAAELEREMLLRESVDAVGLKRQLAAAERLQRSQLPTIAPILDGWDLAGWTAQSQQVGGDFYDWFFVSNGLLAVAIGHAMDRGLEAALAANTLKATVRAHGQYHLEAQQALKQINLTLWTGSAGDQSASLFYGLLETATGRLCSALAGNLHAVLLRSDGWKLLEQALPRLGESPESHYEQSGYQLQPGEAMLLFTEGVFASGQNRPSRPLRMADLVEPLVSQTHLPADALITLMRERLGQMGSANEHDRTMLVIKRTPA